MAEDRIHAREEQTPERLYSTGTTSCITSFLGRF